jgi:hypothetical protein
MVISIGRMAGGGILAISIIISCFIAELIYKKTKTSKAE